VANLFCSPWEDGGQRRRLVWAGQFGSTSTSMMAGSRVPLAKLGASAWVSVFGEAPGAVDLALESG
jgi:hypothetical protein